MTKENLRTEAPHLYRLQKITVILIIISALASLFLISSSPKANDAFANEVTLPPAPSLHNLKGEKIDSVEVGQQSIIRIMAHNSGPTKQTFLLLAEVRDGNGVTTYLFWQNATIDSGDDYTMETSWTPDAECDFPNEACNNYAIRSLAITSFVHPQVLLPVTETKGIIVTGSPPVPSGPGYFDLSLNNQTFQIEYSFSGKGRVTQIEVDKETESMVLFLRAPTDGTLNITMPREFIELAFPRSLADGQEPTVFVDEIPADIVTTYSRTGSLTIVIPVQRGSEQVEVVGSFPI